MDLGNIGFLVGNIKLRRDSIMFNPEISQPQTSLLEQHPAWVRLCLVLMFLLAALIRRDEIRAPGHLIEREYNSAIFTRYYYFMGNDNIEEWRKVNAMATMESLPLLEPPVTEYLVSLIFRILGKEEIWYARYLTGLFWLIGGIFMYKITCRLVSEGAALFAVAYYLFVPWGIIISRSFQPDSLMMMMFLISIFCLLLYFERPSWHMLFLAGSITGISLLLRPLVTFGLLCAFTVLFINTKRERGHRLNNIDFWTFNILGLVFPLAFYGYGIFIGKFLQGQADLSFRPYLLGRWEFWRGWFTNGINVTEPAMIVLAVFGFFLLQKISARALIVGLLIGYLMLGVIFTYHIYSHPYYHIQLFPIIAICAGSLLSAVGKIIAQQMRMSWWMPVTATLLLILYSVHRDVRSMLYTTVFEDPDLSSEIGRIVDHSPNTVFVAYHYGLPLEYYGEFVGLPWPVSIDDPFFRRPDARKLSVEERIDGLGFIPKYFIITNFDLYNRLHQDLRTYLENNCAVLTNTKAYLIYASCGNVSTE